MTIFNGTSVEVFAGLFISLQSPQGFKFSPLIAETGQSA
jgi:hypothetical protein